MIDGWLFALIIVLSVIIIIIINSRSAIGDLTVLSDITEIVSVTL